MQQLATDVLSIPTNGVGHDGLNLFLPLRQRLGLVPHQLLVDDVLQHPQHTSMVRGQCACESNRVHVSHHFAFPCGGNHDPVAGVRCARRRDVQCVGWHLTCGLRLLAVVGAAAVRHLMNQDDMHPCSQCTDSVDAELCRELLKSAVDAAGTGACQDARRAVQLLRMECFLFLPV